MFAACFAATGTGLGGPRGIGATGLRFYDATWSQRFVFGQLRR